MVGIAARAKSFWRTVPPQKSFPREMERAIAYALPLAVIRLPQLTVGSVSRWLLNHGVCAPNEFDRRPLKGCLFAHRSQGLVFVDGSDPPDEVRFVLAHEASHFMLHHLDPRLHAVAKLGKSVLEVLDGIRPPTPNERLAGVFRGVAFGEYLHAIQRESGGRIPSGDVARMETEADLLAFELLAPMASVFKHLSPGRGEPDRAMIAAVLKVQFGLPPGPAEDWAGRIVAQLRRRKGFVDWLDRG